MEEAGLESVRIIIPGLDRSTETSRWAQKSTWNSAPGIFLEMYQNPTFIDG